MALPVVLLVGFLGYQLVSWVRVRLRAPALLHVNDLEALVAVGDRLMRDPVMHGAFSDVQSDRPWPDTPPKDARPLSVLPGVITVAAPDFVRVSAHEVLVSWPDGLGTSLLFLADDEQGRRRAAELRESGFNYTIHELVHPRVWCLTGVH